MEDMFIAGYNRAVCIRTDDESQVWDWLQEQLSEEAQRLDLVELKDDDKEPNERDEQAAALEGHAEAVCSASDVAAGWSVFGDGPYGNAVDLRAALHNHGNYGVRQYWPQEGIWWVAME